jgi:hypothetical protein
MGADVSLHSAAFRIAGLLCIFALLALQAFGPGQLFVCHCEDAVKVTTEASCGVVRGGVCDANAPGGQDQDRHEHVAARDEMAVAFAKAALPAVPLVDIAPWWVTTLVLVDDAQAVPLREHDFGESPPPPGIVVARAVVFLI